MRLLFISNLYDHYARGGAEVVVKRSIEAARAAGHEVALLTARPWRDGGRLRAEVSHDHGFATYSLYPANLFFYGDDHKHSYAMRALWHLLDIGNRPVARQVRLVLNEFKPDAVITHNLMGLGYAIPAEIARAGIRHVHVLHDIQLAVRRGVMLHGQEHRFDTDGLFARAYQACTRRQFGSPDLVLAPSQFLLKFYEHLNFFPDSRRLVLRNPIDVRFFHTTPTKADQFRVLFVGQLVEHKGVRLLQRVWDRFQANHPGQVRCIVVGDGTERSKLEHWVKQGQDRQFLGRVPNESLPAVYAQSDLLVLPTLTYENAPTVVYESLASGVPVCVSDIGGSAEPVQDGVNGFVVPPGDETALLAALETAFARRDEWSTLRLAAKKAVQGQDDQTYINSLLNLINEKATPRNET